MPTFDDFPAPNSEDLAKSSALLQLLRAQINAHPLKSIDFAQFMSQALYHPDWGYYQQPTVRIGKTGDFTTAAEISPLYAACFVEQIRTTFPKPPAIFELGAGSGRFALNLLQSLADTELPDKYYIYEISPALRQAQKKLIAKHCPQHLSRIQWLTDWPNTFSGVIIANEVLDALPVRCFTSAKTVQERRVGLNQHQQFSWVEASITETALAEQAQYLVDTYQLPAQYQFEINVSLPAFMERLGTCLTSGLVLLADYGYGQAEYYHPARSRGTLAGFYLHRRLDDPFCWPGLQDLTAHVDFTQVIEQACQHGFNLAGFTTQAGFLLANQLLKLAAQQEAHLTSAEQFTLHQAIKTLTLPNEMGDVVKIMSLSKDLDTTLTTFAQPDRRRDL